MISSITHQRARERFSNLAEYHQFIHHRSRNADGSAHLVLEVGAVRRMIMLFDRLESELKSINNCDEAPWYQDRPGVHCMPTRARFLWNSMRDSEAEANLEITEGRRLSPWLRIGLHICRKWTPRLRPYRTFSNSIDMSNAYPRRVLSHIYYCIRRIGRHKRFQAILKNEKRKASKNYRSGAKLIVDAFGQDARLLVLRIDLYFLGDAKVESETDAAQKAFMKFKRAFRDGRIVPGALYLLSKREDGLEKRIHYHVMALLDGDKHEDAYRLTEAMGSFWQRECVGSVLLSDYMNCWLRRADYKHNCIGVVHYSDVGMLKGIRDALKYICKQEAHILVSKRLGRNFFKSNGPKREFGRARRGAPRRNPEAFLMAQSILLDTSSHGAIGAKSARG